MVTCLNCGQKASGDYCQCCKYPILRGSLAGSREAERRAKREAKLAAKEQAKREAIEARKAQEAERQAKKEAEEAERRAKREAKLAAKGRAKREAKLAAKEQAKREAIEARKAQEAKKAVRENDSEIYEAEFRLVVPLPAGFEQVRQFEESLKQIENLRIIWTGGSVDEGAIIGVSVQKPMALIRIVNEMPMVEKVYKNGEKIVVVLKTPTVS